MDDHVGLGQSDPAVAVQSQSVGGDVAGHGPDPPARRGEAVRTELGAEPVEAVVAQDLPLEAPLGVGAPAVAHQEGELHLGDGAQQALHQCGAHESRGAGDEDALAGQGVGDHGAPV